MPHTPGGNHPRKPLPPIPKQGGPRKPLPPGTGLLQAMQEQHEAGICLGVLIIDESGDPGNAETASQIRVLEKAHELGLPVFAIEINTELIHDPRSHIIQTPTSLLKYAHKVINKPAFNAFDDGVQPNLEATLTLAGLRKNDAKLVIMGYHVHQCVRLTAVGGWEKPGNTGKLHQGATGRGYKVLTCKAILRGGDVTWRATNGVEFFPRL